MPYPLTPVEIPFEGTMLHGYYYRAPGEGRNPVVVMHNGFDGSVEEMHFFGAAAAVERGYDVLSLDGRELDAALEESMQSEPTARWAFTHGMYAMGVDTPRKFLASYLDYSVANSLAEQIIAPVLVADAEDDLFFQGQAEKLYDHITAPKKLLRFTTAEGAGAHCHPGAQRLAFGRIYDWLDDTLAHHS